MTTRIQLALDLENLEAALALAKLTDPYIDIIEIGTPLVISAGLEAVRQMRKQHPGKTILCDAKIMDAGSMEAGMIFAAGADWATVMACTDEATIADCCGAAKKYHKKIMADMLCAGSVEAAVRRLERLNVDCAAVHVGTDQQKQGQTPLQAMAELRAANPACMTAVAGGITCETAPDYMKLQPDILIVGGGITNMNDPAGAAKRLAEIVRGRV